MFAVCRLNEKDCGLVRSATIAKFICESILVPLVFLLLLTSPASARKKPPLSYHEATVAYHGPRMRNLLEGRADLFYDGDYVCTPGSEHYAPDCRKTVDWWVTESESYAEVVLEDHTILIVTSSAPCLNLGRGLDEHVARTTIEDCQKREPWDRSRVNESDVFFYLDHSDLPRIITEWWEGAKDGEKATLTYLLDGNVVVPDSIAGERQCVWETMSSKLCAQSSKAWCRVLCTSRK